MYNTPSLALLPDLFWPGVVIPVSVPSMCQVDLVANYLYWIGIMISSMCKKKNYIKNVNINIQYMQFPILLA